MADDIIENVDVGWVELTFENGKGRSIAEVFYLKSDGYLYWTRHDPDEYSDLYWGSLEEARKSNAISRIRQLVPSETTAISST